MLNFASQEKIFAYLPPTDMRKGIGGLSAGIALRRAGWDVRIFECAATPRARHVADINRLSGKRAKTNSAIPHHSPRGRRIPPLYR